MKPRLGISRCLLGDAVRYDGGHKCNRTILDAFGVDVEWVPVCPEVEIGMGTPREPIQLVVPHTTGRRAPEALRLVGIQSGKDWTREMCDWAQRRVRELTTLNLSGYVLKTDSPSCGLENVPIYGDSDVTATGRGFFAQALIDAMPNLPVEDEVRLADPRIRQEFMNRVFATSRDRRTFRSA